MKSQKYIGLIFLTLIVLFGCEKPLESDNLSTVTYYPDFTLEGEKEMFVEAGGDVEVPGATATEDDEQIEVSTSVEGIYFGHKGANVNIEVPDKYVVTYSAKNSDGFSGSATRTVYVAKNGDMVNSIEGLYTSSIFRNGVTQTELKYVFIRKVGDNKYAISDGIGGFYDLGYGYGPNYVARGVIITANNISTNSFSFNNPFGVGAFGGNASITSMTVNSGNKTISFVTEWDLGYVFEVTLKQVEF